MHLSSFSGPPHREELGKDISEVRKEITTQTRWILAVMGAAAVLIPIMQRLMATVVPW